VDEGADEAAALAAIQQAQQELKSGASFEELADRYSDLAREPELSGRIANDASMLREILNL